MTSMPLTGSVRLASAVLAASLLLGSHAASAKDACTGSTNNKVLIQQAANNSSVEGGNVTLNIKFPPSNPTVADGGIFTWAQVSGPAVTLSATSGVTTSFTIPHITTGSTAVIVVRATATGATCIGAVPDNNTISINVENVATPNVAPVAVASVSADPVNEGDVVSLIGSGSYDDDGDPLLFAWTQTSGPAVTLVNADMPTATFIAPAVATTTTLGFSLKVTENLPSGKFSTASTSVNVLHLNLPPSVSLTCPAEVNEGGTITLDGSASFDPEGGDLSFSFSQTDGLPLADIPAPPHGSSVSFSAPALGYLQTGHVKFGVTVTDDKAASVSRTCDVFINDVTPPVLSGGDDDTIEATSPLGAIALYDVVGYDNVLGGPIAATCIPPSGSQFALGATPVACEASDGKNIGTLDFTITVVDTTPPVIDTHVDVTEEATGPDGALVSYAAPATHDAYDGDDTADCAPPSGSQFALGDTTVTCNKTDSNGNEADATTFKVFVVDTTAPDISAPADITVEATGLLTPVALVDATATDAVGPVTITNDAPAQFPVGTTLVTWTATDGAMNSSNATSKVTVTDTTGPAIAAHDDVTAIATSAAGAVVTYAVPTAVDLVDGARPVNCDPASGSTFAVGSTTVTCTSVDSRGNASTSSFKVIVSYAFNGFFKPIDNLPTVNVVKAGQGIPVKFSLGGNMGLNIFAAGYPKSVAVMCSTGAPVDVVEETVTAGGSSLSYDTTTGQYVYVWKTDKAWASSCRQLQVKLLDGSMRTANFSFTR